MVIFIFSFNGKNIEIECKKEEKLKDALSKLYSRNKEINPNNILLLYNGSTISNYDLTFNELANSDNKEIKKMNILMIEMNTTTIIKDGKSFIKSKEIICPQCHDNCRISFKDYSINLYECKNRHETNNIPFELFEDTQKIDESKIICHACSKNNKNKSYNKKFYFCLTCKKNICPLCKEIHNKSHVIINYEDRFYICERHNIFYNSYSDDSKINLCMKCQKEKRFKNIINYNNILPNIAKIETQIKYIKGRIIEFIEKIKKFEIILNKILKNAKLFYDIIYQIYTNYDSKKNNYQNLKNMNEIINNMTILNDLNNIISNNNIINNFENIFNIYNQILNNKITTKNIIANKPKEYLTDQELREIYISKELENKEKHKFYDFIFQGDLKGFKECLEGKYGKKYNIFEEISKEGYYWTPLHYAMQYGKWNIIKFIIEYLKSKYLIEVGFRLKSADNRCPLLCLLKSYDIDAMSKRDIFEKIIINFNIPVNDEVKRELKKQGFEDLLGMIKPFISQ